MVSDEPMSSAFLSGGFEETSHRPGVLVLINPASQAKPGRLGAGSTRPQAMTLPVSSEASTRSGAPLLYCSSPPVALWVPEPGRSAASPCSSWPVRGQAQGKAPRNDFHGHYFIILRGRLVLLFSPLHK